MAEQVVPPGFLAGAQSCLEELVEARFARWQRDGLLDGLPAERSFGARFHRGWLDAGKPPCAAVLRDEPPLRDVLGPHLVGGWLRDLVGELVGPDRLTLLESCFYRAKFPGDEQTSLPWHQDAQCLEPVSGVDFITAWIPLVDITETNSCLEVAPVRETQEIYAGAWSDRSGYVCMRSVDAASLAPTRRICLRRGDVLLLSPYLPHRSLDNEEPETRWSIDVRYGRT